MSHEEITRMMERVPDISADFDHYCAVYKKIFEIEELIDQKIIYRLSIGNSCLWFDNISVVTCPNNISITCNSATVHIRVPSRWYTFEDVDGIKLGHLFHELFTTISSLYIKRGRYVYNISFVSPDPNTQPRPDAARNN